MTLFSLPRREYAYLFAILIIAIGGTITVSKIVSPKLIGLLPGIDCTTNYGFINPAPDCESYEAKAEKLENLEEMLSVRVLALEKSAAIKSISIFARDLTTLRWVGVNESILYTPASLLKLPLIVTIYKFAEIYPDILTKKILYDKPIDLSNQGFFVPPSQKIELGQSYSVEELIERVSIYSDNEAAALLSMVIDPSFQNAVYVDLGISLPRENEQFSNYITAKSYASILRALYNSSYLSREYSEKALELLAQSNFKDGIVAGVPRGIQVSHKFGERGVKDAEGNITSVSFHDCGIVYSNKQPYSICIMTIGNDFATQRQIIADLSKLVYENIY